MSWHLKQHGKQNSTFHIITIYFMLTLSLINPRQIIKRLKLLKLIEKQLHEH